jgi:prepilin-type N-terminal cleavage/methylation domain-containing protein
LNNLKLTKISLVGSHPTNGFTLIELLLVVAVMLILGLSSVPLYSRFFTQNSTANTVDKIIQLVRKAQFYAMTSRKSNSSGWGVYYSAPTITFYQGSSYASRTTDWDETYTVDGSVTVTGLTEINFARLSGSPTPTSASIVVTGNQGTTDTLTMNAQGMITR